MVMRDIAIRLHSVLELHRRLLNAATIAAFVAVSAHYANFIHLPEIVALPVMVTGLLTGARYAIWLGYIKRQVEAQTPERD